MGDLQCRMSISGMSLFAIFLQFPCRFLKGRMSHVEFEKYLMSFCLLLILMATSQDFRENLTYYLSPFSDHEPFPESLLL